MQPHPIKAEAGAITTARVPEWDLALASFLATKTPHTRRSYAYTLRDFYGIAGKTPDAITALDVAAYRVSLEARGNAPGTVANRMAAVSSFYRFLCRPADARGRSLAVSNPAYGIERPKVSPYHRAHKLALEDLRAILASLGGLDDVAALRDRALLLCYVFTGRRRAEIARLCGGDLERDDRGRLFYRYTGKGGKAGRRELPPPAADSLRAYLQASGREGLPADAPLFVSVSGRTHGQALAPDGVLRILKARARAAGVAPSRVRTHGLRHLGAELRRRAGAAVEEIRDFLDHAHLNTTAIYLRQLEGMEDRTWQEVAAILEGVAPPAGAAAR